MIISVVIPVLNCATFIEEAVRSALNQGEIVGEVIVVDDSSTDDTVDIVRSILDPRVRVVSNRGQGTSAARNTGVAASRGQWLHFLDADDRLRPGGLNALLSAVDQFQSVEVVYGDYERIDSKGLRIGRRGILRLRVKPSGHILLSLLRGNFILVGALICRRSVFDLSGGFNENLTLCEDWHFWCRLATVATFLHAPKSYIFDYRIHAMSTMHATPRQFSQYKPAIELVFKDPAILDRVSGPALAALRPIAEASLMTYTATEAIRLGAYAISAQSTWRAIRTAPSQTPRVLSRVFGTVVGL